MIIEHSAIRRRSTKTETGCTRGCIGRDTRSTCLPLKIPRVFLVRSPRRVLEIAREQRGGVPLATRRGIRSSKSQHTLFIPCASRHSFKRSSSSLFRDKRQRDILVSGIERSIVKEWVLLFTRVLFSGEIDGLRFIFHYFSHIFRSYLQDGFVFLDFGGGGVVLYGKFCLNV